MAESADSFKRGNESLVTYGLKWASWEWLYKSIGCRSIGLEVKLEGPYGRVIDVVAVGPDNTIYAVEVKASRADLFRDDHTHKDRAKLAAKKPSVEDRTELAEEILKRAADYAKQRDPANWESVDIYRQATEDYERVTHQEESYRQRLERYSIKFGDPRFLALADYHYIMTPKGLIKRNEVPPRWGLLDDAPSEVVPAPRKEVRKNPGIISNVLRSIARANTSSMMRHAGVTFHEGRPFPHGIPPRRDPSPHPGLHRSCLLRQVLCKFLNRRFGFPLDDRLSHLPQPPQERYITDDGQLRLVRRQLDKAHVNRCADASSNPAVGALQPYRCAPGVPIHNKDGEVPRDGQAHRPHSDLHGTSVARIIHPGQVLHAGKTPAHTVYIRQQVPRFATASGQCQGLFYLHRDTSPARSRARSRA